jgi:transcriptional regulator with XRE-family HTH domain
MPENIVTIGDAIRRNRQMAKMTQDDLAKRCGLSRNYICQIETGRKSPAFGTLNEIAHAIGVRIELIVGEDHVVGELRRIVNRANANQVMTDLKKLIKRLR